MIAPALKTGLSMEDSVEFESDGLICRARGISGWPHLGAGFAEPDPCNIRRFSWRGSPGDLKVSGDDREDDLPVAIEAWICARDPVEVWSLFPLSRRPKRSSGQGDSHKWAAGHRPDKSGRPVGAADRRGEPGLGASATAGDRVCRNRRAKPIWNGTGAEADLPFLPMKGRYWIAGRTSTGPWNMISSSERTLLCGHGLLPYDTLRVSVSGRPISA